MTQNVTDALVLKATDFRENDKIVHLLSLKEGKMSGVLKGVKKASAKLKFAGEPFCFAEFTYVRRGDMATIITAEEKESFFAIRTDIERFYCGCAVAETAAAFSQEGQPDEKLFYLTLDVLRDLSAGKEPKPQLIRYMLAVLENFGQKPSFDSCAECGAKIAEGKSARFVFSSGGVLCERCAPPYARRIDAGVLKTLGEINLDGANASDTALKRAVDFLGTIMEENFKKINSLKQIALL